MEEPAMIAAYSGDSSSPYSGFERCYPEKKIAKVFENEMEDTAMVEVLSQFYLDPFMVEMFVRSSHASVAVLSRYVFDPEYYSAWPFIIQHPNATIEHIENIMEHRNLVNWFAVEKALCTSPFAAEQQFFDILLRNNMPSTIQERTIPFRKRDEKILLMQYLLSNSLLSLKQRRLATDCLHALFNYTSQKFA